MDNLTIGFYTVLNEVIDRLKLAGCKVVTFDDRDAYSNGKNLVTPSASISPGSFDVISGTESSISLEIFFFGQLAFTKVTTDDAPKFGQENKIDIQAESMAIASRFTAPLLNRTLQIEGTNGGYLVLKSSPSFTSVLVEGNDHVSGIVGTLTFNFTSFNSSCG